jgi:hypothetical protein
MDQNHLQIINQQHDDNNRYFISKFSYIFKREAILLFLYLLFFSMQCVWVFFFRLCSKRFCFVFICLKLIVKIRHCAFLICVYMKNCSLIDRTYCDDQGCLLILIEQIIIKFFILIVYYILK